MTHDIRQQIIKQRQTLSTQIVHEKSQVIQQTLINQFYYQQADKIAAYFAFKNEVNLSLILTDEKKIMALPVLHPAKINRLWFAKYQKDTPLIKNRFNINEPTYHENSLILPWQLDLVLVPLSVFDSNCHRLGMGGGFYDRTFAFRQTPFRQKPVLVGVAFEMQKVDKIIAEPWDVQLDYVITENKIYHRNPS